MRVIDAGLGWEESLLTTMVVNAGVGGEGESAGGTSAGGEDLAADGDEMASNVGMSGQDDLPNKEVKSSEAPVGARRLCLIDGQCSAQELAGGSRQMVRQDDSEIAYRLWNVGNDVKACLARARQWHLHCQNPLSMPITATYVPTSDSHTFPDSQALHHDELRRDWVLPPSSSL
jgi:hypothetical protein